MPINPMHRVVNYRKVNVLKAIHSDLELQSFDRKETHFRKNYYYKTYFKIHEKYLTGKFTEHLTHRDYTVIDNTKVVGYLINGYFFNFKYLYGD